MKRFLSFLVACVIILALAICCSATDELFSNKDINNDGLCNIKDVLLLLKAFINDTDINGEQKASLSDVIALLKHTISDFDDIPKVFSTLPLSPKEEITIVNVKDFGAVGDGKTDDKAAIVSAFYYAINNLPATVYFPEGEYGLLNGGMYIKMPLGSGFLTVKGDGAEKSIIKYLDDWQPAGTWVAIRLMPQSTPSTQEEYLHDLTITDLGVYDTNPVEHAWTVEEDGAKEETHGFDIQHCIRAVIKDCKVNNVGDEAIDMVYCIDSMIVNNTIVNSPGAGAGGGAISVGDGCNNLLIAQNSVTGTIQAEDKGNFGIAVEALTISAKNILILNNTISDINGYGINIGAPAGTIDNVTIRNNKIYNSTNGIRIMGSGKKTDITLQHFMIYNVENGVIIDGGNSDNIQIHDFLIKNVKIYTIRILSTGSQNTVISDGTIENAMHTVLYNSGTNTQFNNINVNGVGIGKNIKAAAIRQYTSGGNLDISNLVMLNCQNSKGIQGATNIINTTIEQPETSGFVSISGAKYIQGGKVNRIVQNLQSYGTIDGLTIQTSADLGTHAITLSNKTNCTIKNCVINIPSRNAIHEAGTSDYNVFTNNTITGGKIKVIGANSVSSDNVIN